MNPESYTLLVYSNLPEDVHLYLIPNDEITTEHLLLLMEANDKLVNNDDLNPGMEFLMAALTVEAKDCNPDVPKEWHCIWNKYKVGKVPLVDSNLHAPITRVFKSGFIL